MPDSQSKLWEEEKDDALLGNMKEPREEAKPSGEGEHTGEGPAPTEDEK